MPRKNHRSDDHRSDDHRADGRREHRPEGRTESGVTDHSRPARPGAGRQQVPGPSRGRHVSPLDMAEPDPFEMRAGSRPYNVILTAHAQRQLEELGSSAERALQYLKEAGRDELQWSAQPMPAQHGRDVWLLGAGAVRVLLDIEGEDLTIQGFGLQPHHRSRYW
jgi:hypothetical protein